jgi:hypothetical protein
MNESFTLNYSHMFLCKVIATSPGPLRATQDTIVRHSGHAHARASTSARLFLVEQLTARARNGRAKQAYVSRHRSIPPPCRLPVYRRAPYDAASHINTLSGLWFCHYVGNRFDSQVLQLGQMHQRKRALRRRPRRRHQHPNDFLR